MTAETLGEEPCIGVAEVRVQGRDVVPHRGHGRNSDPSYQQGIMQLPVCPLHIFLHESHYGLIDLVVLLRLQDHRFVNRVRAGSAWPDFCFRASSAWDVGSARAGNDWPELCLSPGVLCVLLVRLAHVIPRPLLPSRRVFHDNIFLL